MFAIVGTLAWAACLLPAAAELTPGSFLTVQRTGPDGVVQTVVEPYIPQEGDLVMFNDHSKVWKFLYRMAGSDLPDHSGIVVKLPDGRPALLEAGPDDGALAGFYVCIIEAYGRLQSYKGTIYIRRLKCPLTREHSEALTNFAIAQQGKRYAVCRLLLQGTPCRCRGKMRMDMFGKTHLDRKRWLCAEIAVAAGTHAGLFDPKIHRANTMYPLDILVDDKYDLSHNWEQYGVWGPDQTPRSDNR